MKERINLLKWKLEVDRNMTKDFFSNDIELCDCLYCENYLEACKHIASPVMEIFTALGIIPFKPSHLSEFGETDDGLRLYSGSYHIVGNILDGECCIDSNWNDSNTARVENFTFGFTKELIFVPDGFPSPVLQLDFEARIPWMLSEKPEE